MSEPEQKPKSTSSLFEHQVEQAENMARRQHGEALLLLGEVQDAVPRALVMDPDLPAIAVRIWCYLRLSADNSKMMAPSYSDIMQDINIGSKETVSHAYHVLRLTRWLTLITRYTSRFGYRIGNVYGLHTSPATIRQTMELDASYLSFVQYLCGLDAQRHARIRALAERVRDGIMQAAEPCDNPVADALSRVIGTQVGDRSTNVYYRAAATDPFENAAGSLEYLSDIPPPGTGGPEAVASADPDWHDDILHFTKQTKRIVRVKFASVPDELRQPFLNELAVLVRERRKTADPIRNPPAYLSKMIQEYEKGNLVLSNRAEQLEQERLEAARSAEKERKRNHEEEMRDLDHLKRMNRLRPNSEIQKQIEQLSARLESRSDVRSIRTDSVS